MKKLLIYLFLTFMVIANVCLIFFWEPERKTNVGDNVSKETISYTKSIYKVEKDKILEKLSDDDKKEVDTILKKLSTFDMGKIKEYYQDSDEDEGILNIFKILKKRLTSEDYKKMQQLGSSFLDIDAINNRIKNK